MLRSRILIALFATLFPFSVQAATSIPLTINMSESVTVTGTPRVAVDVGGQIRYATYTSGSGTNALTFTLNPQVGDVDLDGITINSPVDLNGGTMKDAAGNDATLTFTPPTTSGILVNYPSVGMNFIYDADGRYTLNGSVYNDLTSFLSAAGGSFSRGSIGTYFDSAGTLQTAASGVPRFDYDPITHVAKGILIEEARTNFLKYSSEIGNTSAWSNNASSSVVSDSLAAPDGTTSADKISDDTTYNYHMRSQPVTAASAGTYTYSVYVKKSTARYIVIQILVDYNSAAKRYSINFDMDTGLVTATNTSGTPVGTGYTITAVNNGWYRLSISSTHTNGDIYCYIALSNGASPTFPLGLPLYLGSASNTVYAWGAQLEKATFPTSYIPTSTSTVTRQADTLTLPTGAWYNSSSGGVLAIGDIPYLGGASWPGFVSLDDGTNSNAMHLFINDAGSDTKNFEIYKAGGIETQYTGAVYTAGATTKQGMAYETNNSRASMDGTMLSLDTSVNIPSVSILRIGNGRSGNKHLNGHIQKMNYYPLRPTDTQLQKLTQ